MTERSGGLVVDQLLINEDRFDAARQCTVSTAVRQDQIAARVVDQQLKAVQGIGNIERDIGNIGLQGGQQGHHRIDRTFQVDSDRPILITSSFGQQVRKRPGFSVQIPIGYFGFAFDEGHPIWKSFDLLMEQLLDPRCSVIA